MVKKKRSRSWADLIGKHAEDQGNAELQAAAVHYQQKPNDHVLGCGLLFKPTCDDGYVDRVRNDFVAIYVLRGCGRFTDHLGQVFEVKVGDFICQPPGYRHSVEQYGDGQWAECFILMTAEFYQLLERAGVLPHTPEVVAVGLLRGLIDRFETINKHLQTYVPEQQYETSLEAHKLLVDMARLRHDQQWQDPLAKRIESARLELTSCLTQEIDMHKLARACDLSYEYFRKCFKKQVGLSPGQYLIHHRIEHAQQLLIRDRLSVKRVAFELGYPDPFSFSRQFKKIVGRSPSQFLKDYHA